MSLRCTLVVILALCSTPICMAADPAPEAAAAEPAGSDTPGHESVAGCKNLPANTPMSKLMTCAHNVVRANVAPQPAEPLPDLLWSEALARGARQHAQECKFAHSGRFDVGENLAVFSDINTDPLTVVKAWAAEAQNFNYDTNRCKKGEVCGHYTQLIWRGTTQLGCGVAHCPSIEGFPYSGALWVCNYSPAGNVLGHRPY